jgi:hypothetical protein
MSGELRFVRLMARRHGSIGRSPETPLAPIWVRSDQVVAFTSYGVGCHVILAGGAEYEIEVTPGALLDALVPTTWVEREAPRYG